VNAKPRVSFEAIASRIRETRFADADAVVGILTGGAVPAAMIAFHLGLPLYVMGINFRTPGDHSPRHSEPVLTSAIPEIPDSIRRILLVDDVSVTGSTMTKARTALSRFTIQTIALKGQKADIILFPEWKGCVQWPWNPPEP